LVHLDVILVCIDPFCTLWVCWAKKRLRTTDHVFHLIYVLNVVIWSQNCMIKALALKNTSSSLKYFLLICQHLFFVQKNHFKLDQTDHLLIDPDLVIIKWMNWNHFSKYTINCYTFSIEQFLKNILNATLSMRSLKVFFLLLTVWNITERLLLYDRDTNE
jgi:hypothetical protein